jgi:hypothetical protein
MQCLDLQLVEFLISKIKISGSSVAEEGDPVQSRDNRKNQELEEQCIARC